MKHFPHMESGDDSERVSPCPLVALQRHREEADDYAAVVVLLNASWRVILCRDGIQWILQQRAGQRHGQPRWEGRAYCRTREGLMARIHALVGETASAAQAVLWSLPKICGGRTDGN